MRSKLLALLLLLSFFTGCKQSTDCHYQDWLITFDNESRAIHLFYQDKALLKGVVSRYKLDDRYVATAEYPRVSLKESTFTDMIGRGKKVTYQYGGLKGHPNLHHVFYFYEGDSICLIETLLVGKDSIASNYIAPIYTETDCAWLENDTTNRVLTIPFDNDNFVPYKSSPLSIQDTSSEVTAFFTGSSRKGLVIGSVEHDTWKTGISFATSNHNQVNKLEAFGGLANEATRDVSSKKDRPSCEHGYVNGRTIKSPKLFVGFFADWRRGLEAYGQTCAKIAPPRKWDKGVPFGWNSWAAMATRVNYEGAIDVADFIHTDLQPNNFNNDQTVYIGLDSYWDTFSTEQLKDFVKHCHQNGQKAGIYWGPFSDWYANGEAYVEGTDNQWRYKDIYLYAPNGQPRKIESLAIDPTHPATKRRMDHYIGMFKEMGYEYIKLDFINNGTLEAVSFHNPSVTTGKQAYNEGMAYLTEICGDDMFIALSIAPTFPAQYGTSKRISCDVWGAMTEGDIGTIGYMLNSLSFGWWLDRVYPFNDADHILLYQSDQLEDYTLGANRARVTSAVITGIYMLGDNFSLKGSFIGNPEARKRAMEVVTNPDINDIARLRQSFYPVDGYKASAPHKTETQFMLETENSTYFVVFNFDKTAPSIGSVNLERISIHTDTNLQVKELWTSEQFTTKDNQLPFHVPPQDVRVYQVQH